jgi:DNA mismatch endonuclease, patch repair protein
MADTLTAAQRSERMARVKGKDTNPELVIRKLVYGLGYRYRLHVRELPGSPDLVFRKLRKIIFVHGCFWHRHPAATCKLARLPKSRVSFWRAKLEGNQRRDKTNVRRLRRDGWKVLQIWECQLANV